MTLPCACCACCRGQIDPMTAYTLGPEHNTNGVTYAGLVICGVCSHLKWGDAMRRIDARRRSTPGPIEIVIEVRRPTLRNAIGHLVCSTGREGCAVSSEYAEPDPGGGWTCYECKATKDW